jgi:hypothetical protein
MLAKLGPQGIFDDEVDGDTRLVDPLDERVGNLDVYVRH